MAPSLHERFRSEKGAKEWYLKGVRVLRLVPAALLALTVSACGAASAPPGGAAVVPIAATCSTTLSPRGPSVPALPPAEGASPAALSLLVVDADFPLKRLQDTLETRAPKRVAEEKDHDIGMAGRLQYTVDRGKFSAAVEGDSLVVSVPLVARVEACAKGRCYSSCTPEARVSTRVPLRLGTDERLHASDVSVDVTKGCTLRAGFISIDVTPIIRGQVAQRKAQLLAAIDRELPDLRPQAKRLWSELQKPRPLPLGSCLVLAPEALVIGSASGSKTNARVRFGLYARPELRSSCDGAPPPTKRPPIRFDAALPQNGEVHLGVMLNDQVLRDAFVSRLPNDLVEGRASVANVQGGVARGVDLTLSGEVCGDVQIRATGATLVDEAHVSLAGVSLTPEESERLTRANVTPETFTRAVEKTPIRLPFRAEDLAAVLPDLANAMSDDTLTVSATASEGAAEGAFVRGDALFAVMRMRTSGSLVAK